METKDYLNDIRDIKNMMAQSTQFISLSGLSGIIAGIYALIGSYFAYGILSQLDSQPYENRYDSSAQEITITLLLIALSIILLSIVTGVILSAAKAKKEGEKLWNSTSKRVLINFGIPLIAGGIFALLLLQKEYYGLMAPVTLLFYGMGCVNASKFTFRDVRYLGITLIILGLLCTYYMDYGLLFWTTGFGFCHILYGSVMYFKYDRK